MADQNARVVSPCLLSDNRWRLTGLTASINCKTFGWLAFVTLLFVWAWPIDISCSLDVLTFTYIFFPNYFASSDSALFNSIFFYEQDVLNI